MTHEETIKRIQELVPSIMELEFGCQGENKVTKQKFFIVKNSNPMGNEDADITMFSNDSHYLYEGYSKDEDITILGKPITLSVLCLALENNRTEVILTICSDGMHIGHFDQKGYYTHCYWNLSKDNFNDQSEETKTFIGGLLSN